MLVASVPRRQPDAGTLLWVMSTAITLTPLRLARAASPLILLAGWTLFVWVGRIRNILADESLTGAAFAIRMGTAVVFTAAGAVLAVALAWYIRTRHPFALPLITWIGVGLSVVGALFWAVRGTTIAFGDYDLGFKVVHSVLAVVTIAIGILVVKWATLVGNRLVADDHG